MKRLWTIAALLLLVLCGVLFLGGDTTTPRLGLTQPSSGTSGWGTNVNGWATAIDNLFGGSFTSQTLTDASPLAWDLASATTANYSVTLDHTTATRALNVSNLVNGGSYQLKIAQDATGGAAMTLGTGCTWKVSTSGSTTITLNPAASAVDILKFTYDGTNCLATLQSQAGRTVACDIQIGDGLNAVAAGTYPIVGCKNDKGQTVTFTKVECYRDSGSTSSCDATTSHSGTPDILTGGPLGGSTSFAGGTLSGTNLLNGEWLNASLVADGTSKEIILHVVGHL